MPDSLMMASNLKPLKIIAGADSHSFSLACAPAQVHDLHIFCEFSIRMLGILGGSQISSPAPEDCGTLVA
jgi:hypothetical protein